MIPENYLKPFDDTYDCDAWGRTSRYFYEPESLEKLGIEYKPGRGYKIVVDGTGDVSDKAIIGQILSFEGIAPKIYKLGKFTGYDMFEVEHLEGDRYTAANNYTLDRLREALKKYPFIIPYEIDLLNANNYIGDKFVDFHGFQINRTKFKKWLENEVNQKTHWGHNNDNNEPFSYQSCEWNGKRDMNYRIKQMKLDTINFKNKRVLDVGCNLGLFLHYVSQNGGSGVGFDLPEVMNVANIYKYWTMPYADIEIRQPDEQFDIQFHFAMVHSLGYPKPIAPLTIFEGHNLQTKESVEVELKNSFGRVEFINYTEDRGKRPVFWCWR